MWRWIRQGCDLRDPKSVREWLTRNEIRKTNIQRSREKRRNKKDADNVSIHPPESAVKPQTHSDGSGNSELPPAGQKGAQLALSRLESQEAAAYDRLQLALQRGSPVEVENAQLFWVRCVESLRKLDLSIELARRDAEQQVPLRAAQAAVTATAEWLRVATTTFLSSETIPLMAFKDPGEFRSYFGQRFKGNLDLTVKNADKTCSAVPDWAKAAIKTAWNVQ